VQQDAYQDTEGTFLSLPFGDNLTLTGNPGATEHQFTSKERDTESGLDYFGARHYASSTGRFMSPDPSALYYADPTNPQSFNLYSYVLNNPLTNIDPTGLDCVQDNGDGTVSTNTGDCANENEAAANAEHYINCDGCTSGAAGANLDAATGSLYLTDANGNGIGGTTVSDFADPQGTPATDVTVNGSAPYLDTISGFGITPDVDSQRIQQLVQGVAQDTRSLPWLCNASASLRAQVPRTPFSFGMNVDRNGLGATGRAGATTPFGGAFLTTNGKNVGAQVSAPISPILNATVSTGKNQFTVGLSRRFQFGGQLSAGGSLTFGFLGDSGCR
jgi:RHS repeat-associated protein